MSKRILNCGHSENSSTNTGEPSCAICFGIHDTSVAEIQPSLDGRTAKCAYNNPHGKCKSEKPSDTNLAFFEYQPNKEFDMYYCGCYGWD